MIDVQKALLKMALGKNLITISEFTSAIENIEKKDKSKMQNNTCYVDKIR